MRNPWGRHGAFKTLDGLVTQLRGFVIFACLEKVMPTVLTLTDMIMFKGLEASDDIWLEMEI